MSSEQRVSETNVKKARNVENTNSLTKTKVAAKTIVSSTQQKGTTKASNSATPPSICCVVCKGLHCFWQCRVFKEKSHTQKVAADGKLCFSCARVNHTFGKRHQNAGIAMIALALTTNFSMKLRINIYHKCLETK